jgi:2-polyprenyl-3-methyl-5-hydroxy-6-metoxy-1,4-benzoquinol methylase
MVCYLCGKSDFVDRPGKVRDIEEIKVIECTNCGLVTLSRTDYISERHYEEGKMHSTEISINDWLKSTETDDQRRFEMFKPKLIGKNILDFGCGNGGFLLLSKPYANKTIGIELEERMQPFFEEQKLKVWNSLKEATENSTDRYDLITAFHVFEHLSDPASVLVDLSKLLHENGEIIIEVPSSEDALLTLYKNEAFSNFTYWSQHLFLFNQHTMVDLIRKSGLKLNYVKQVQRYGLANHLYWLSNDRPGGHAIWSFLSSKELDKVYAQQLSSIGRSDTILASISIKK